MAIDYLKWKEKAVKRGLLPRIYDIEKFDKPICQLFVISAPRYMQKDKIEIMYYRGLEKLARLENTICLFEADKLSLKAVARDPRIYDDSIDKGVDENLQHTEIQLIEQCGNLGLKIGTLLSKPVLETYTALNKKYDKDDVALSYTLFTTLPMLPHKISDTSVKFDSKSMPYFVLTYAMCRYLMENKNSIKTFLESSYEESSYKDFMSSVDEKIFKKIIDKFFTHPPIGKDGSNFEIKDPKLTELIKISNEHSFDLNKDISSNLCRYVSSGKYSHVVAFMGAAHVSSSIKLASDELGKKNIKLRRYGKDMFEYGISINF